MWRRYQNGGPPGAFIFAASRLRSRALLGAIKGAPGLLAGAPHGTQLGGLTCGLAPGPQATRGLETEASVWKSRVPPWPPCQHSDPRGPDARFFIFLFLKMLRFWLRQRARSGDEEGRVTLAEMGLGSTVSVAQCQAWGDVSALGIGSLGSRRGGNPRGDVRTHNVWAQMCGPRGGTLPGTDNCHPTLPLLPVPSVTFG